MPGQETNSASSEVLARRLGLRRSGKRYIGACPACGYSDSFAVCDGTDRPSVFCYACQDTDAVVLAIWRRGLWHHCGETNQLNVVKALPRELSRAGIWVCELWIRAAAAAGTLVEIYLRSRGIVMPVPPTLRFLPQTKHSPSDQLLPAMTAAVTIWPVRRPCAVHRTFLAGDGGGKAAVDTPRMTLGPCRRGAVRLAEALTASGFPTAAKTLATKASRGGGPPYRKYGPWPLYRWGGRTGVGARPFGRVALQHIEAQQFDGFGRTAVVPPRPSRTLHADKMKNSDTVFRPCRSFLSSTILAKGT